MADRPPRGPWLTKRGGTLAGASCGLILGSRLLGADELAVLGVTGLVLVVVAIVSSRARRVRRAARRVQHPARLQVGASGRIELELTNVGTRPTPITTIADGFDDGRRAARFLVAPVAPGATARAAYRVPTNRRGRFRVGPLVATVTDPFGVARREWQIESTAEIVVCPRVHAILPPGGGSGREPGPDPTTNAHGIVQEERGEFRTLRDYEVGDELRRIHWRTSARTGRLVVRQDEAPYLPRVAVVLDVRSPAFDGPSFETAIEAAASVVSCVRRERRPVELVTSAGSNLTGATPEAPHALLEQLAILQPDPAGSADQLPRVLAGLRRRRGTGLVVAVVGTLDEPTELALAGLAAHVGVIVVVTNTSPGGTGAFARPTGRPIARYLVVDATETPFPDAWNRTIRRWTSATASFRP